MFPRGRPALPGDSGPGLWARVVDQLSQVTRASAQDLAWSASSAAQLGSCSSARDVETAAPGDSVSGRRARWVDQPSRTIWADARDLAWSASCPTQLGSGSECLRCRPAVPGDSGLCPMVRGVEQLSRASHTWVECPQGLPAISDDSGSCPRAREVNLRSWVTWARALRPAVSTIFPGPLGPGSEGPQVRHALPGESRLGPMACTVDQLSRLTRTPG